MLSVGVYTQTHRHRHTLSNAYASGLLTVGTWHQKDSEKNGKGNAVAAGKLRLPWGEDEYFQFSQM